MNEVSTTNPNEDVGPIYLDEISCTPESKAEWVSARCDQLKEMLREMAAQCREKDAELEALRKIAACFEKGDADKIDWIIYEKIECDMLYRLKKAAKLAEDAPRQPVIVPRDGDVDLLRELFVLSSLGEYEKFEDLEAWQKRQVRANQMCSRYIDQIEGETPNEQRKDGL